MIVKICDSILSKGKVDAKQYSETLQTATSLKQVLDNIKALEPKLYEVIVEKDYQIYKNIFLVLNEEIVNRNEYERLKFDCNSILEIMLQFGGG